MQTETAAPTAGSPPPLRISRTFPVRRELVFKAWSSAEHVKAWFSPEVYTCPEAQVEMRVGGAFDVLMRSPGGEEHWTRGRFTEVSPYDRLVLDIGATDAAGRRLFDALTEVSFIEVEGGTRMDVVQSYTFRDPAMAAPMVAGAAEGWRTTLDKLEREMARITNAEPVDDHAAAKARIPEAASRSVAHATFHLERTYDAPVARVWTALTERGAKDQWFGGGDFQWLERSMDVRPGGTEHAKGRWPSGVVSTFDATYYDVIPNQRLVYAYEMHLDERKISVSVATMQLQAEGAKTTLLVTEQGAFLDGYDDAGSREHGTRALLEALGRSVEG
jgi:uncharacterized protein YndB with AHSA1/START domain